MKGNNKTFFKVETDDLFELGNGISSQSELDAQRHADSYSRILETYATSIKISMIIKHFLKGFFFLIVMGSLVVLVATTVYIVLNMYTVIDNKGIDKLTIENASGILATTLPIIATLITALLKLPEIIAEYLFNKKENADMNHIIQTIQNHDRYMAELKEDVDTLKPKKADGHQKEKGHKSK